jgi:hypothetical protein
MDSHLNCCSIMYYYVFFTPEPFNQGGGLRSHKRFPQQQKRCYVRVFPKLFVWWLMSYLCYYVSPSNEGRHIVLVWFFSSASASAASASSQRSHHTCFVFPDRSIIFGMWVHDHKAVCRVLYWPLNSRSNNCFLNSIYLVCGCMTIRRCVAYRNDLRGTLTFDLKVK